MAILIVSQIKSMNSKWLEKLIENTYIFFLISTRPGKHFKYHSEQKQWQSRKSCQVYSTTTRNSEEF